MTLRQFEAALTRCKKRVTWHPHREGIRGHLRRAPHLALIECCPITAVVYEGTGMAFPLSETIAAAGVLSLNDTTTGNIITAADSATCDLPNCAHCALRARLRACVGVPPEEVSRW